MAEGAGARARPALAGLLGAPLLGLALGGAGILVARRGAGDRPALQVAVLALGIAAALLPLEAGLPLAVVLAMLGGFVLDFVGGPGAYWDEAFVAVLAARSLWLRRPAPWELAAAGTVALFFGGYLATGTKPLAVCWGLKVLIASLVAGWAVARLRPGPRVWPATYLGLAAGAVAAVTLAAWQRHVGIEGLRALGLDDPQRLKLSRDAEVLRVFGGFTSATPFSFALAIALLLWLALLLGTRRERMLALWTAWLPPVALTGIVWAVNRTAVVALAAAVLVGSLRHAWRVRAIALLLAVAVAAAGVAVLSSSWYRDELRSGVTLGSDDQRGRAGGWRAYLEAATLFGAGPASAGSAYARAHPYRFRPPSALFPHGWWRPQYSKTGVPYRWAVEDFGLVVHPRRGNRPPTTVTAEIRSWAVPRRLVGRLGTRIVYRARVPADRSIRLEARLPAGLGPARLEFEGTPPRQPGPEDQGRFLRAPVAFRIVRVAVHGLPPAATPAERIYDARFHDPLEPGVVDSQYVSWLFEYGVLGGLPIALWLALLLAPLVLRRFGGSLAAAAQLVGVFLVVGALAVNIWEEAPTDLLAALVLGQAFAVARAERRPRHPADDVD